MFMALSACFRLGVRLLDLFHLGGAAQNAEDNTAEGMRNALCPAEL
jgi:hypothetical protein